MRFFGRRVPPEGAVRTGTYAKTALASARLAQAEDAPQAAREAHIVAYYRSALLRAQAELSDAWALYDATPHAGYDTRHVRVARQALGSALEEYREACASLPAGQGVSSKAIAHVISAAEETDRRIAALEHELNAEVRRFELLASDVAEEDDAAAAADDALTELLAYRSNQGSTRRLRVATDANSRLDAVEAKLRALCDHDPKVTPSRRRPPKRPPPVPSPSNSTVTATGSGGTGTSGGSPHRGAVPLPDDEFECVPSAPEPREFPPIPPPSQQNLTKLVQTAKLYKNEMERNRLSSRVVEQEGQRHGHGRSRATSGTLRHSRIDGSQRRGTSLRAGALRSHSLRVPSLRRRNMSHPVPPERDSTLGQRPVDRRSRSMFGMRVQPRDSTATSAATSALGGSSFPSGPRRLTSGLGFFSRASTQRDVLPRDSEASSAALEDPLHTRLSKTVSAMRGDVRSSVIEADTSRLKAASRVRGRNVSDDSFGGARRSGSLGSSMRSFLGKVRQHSGHQRYGEQATNAAARLRRDSSTFDREHQHDPPGAHDRPDPITTGTDADTAAAANRNSVEASRRASVDVRPKGRDDPTTTITSPLVEEHPHGGAVELNTGYSDGAVQRHHHSLPILATRPSLSLEGVQCNGLPSAEVLDAPSSASVSSQEMDLYTPAVTNGTDSDEPITPPSRPSSGSRTRTPSPDNDIIMKDKPSSSSSGSSATSAISAQGEALPQGLVLPRAPTLRDHAEFARSQAENPPTDDGESLLGRDGAVPDDGESLLGNDESGRLSVRRTSASSFSATLYATTQAQRRAEAVSDAGVLLTCSRVLGDGRCLFRSVVRGRAVAAGQPMPRPTAEKKAADKLRARTVAELRRHRGLLLRFYVIEDNFERYIERMANPKTYAGEPELLMLAKMLKTPIAVYLLLNGAYRRIQLYGKHYQGEPIRLRYVNDTHYDYLKVCNAL